MNQIWVEKYKPLLATQYKFQSPANEKYITKLLAENDIPNLMIGGIQGTGKTALVEMLMNELSVHPRDIKHINASSDNGIDNIRNDVVNFCSLFPNGEYRVIILEEADGLTPQAQKALRAVIDKYQSGTRFVFTCNYPHKIIDALHSRCQDIYLDKFDEGTMLLHAADILELEEIAFDPQILIDHVKKYNPDMRKVIQSIQQASTNDENTLMEVGYGQLNSEIVDKWEELWENPQFDELVEVVQHIDNTNFEEMYEIMYNNIGNLPEKDQNRAYAELPEYMDRSYRVALQSANMRGYLIEIFNKV